MRTRAASVDTQNRRRFQSVIATRLVSGMIPEPYAR